MDNEQSNKAAPGKRLTLADILRLEGLFAFAGWGLLLALDLFKPQIFTVDLAALLWGIVLTIALILIALASERLLPQFTAQLSADLVRLWRTIDVQLTPATIVLISLAAGVCEELFFRAALQGYLVEQTPAWLAITIASLVFGAFHASSVRYFCATSVLGLVFGYVYYRTGSLTAVVFGHTVYDIWALHQLDKLLRDADNDMTEDQQ